MLEARASRRAVVTARQHLRSTVSGVRTDPAAARGEDVSHNWPHADPAASAMDRVVTVRHRGSTGAARVTTLNVNDRFGDGICGAVIAVTAQGWEEVAPMHENGATTNNRGGVICCEPRVWLENGSFPIAYTDGAGPVAPPDPSFAETLDRLWRAVLRDPADRAAYRRYEPLLWPDERAQAFVARLSPGALRRFLAAAGVDWRTPPQEPTCDHVACHREYLFAADEWALSTQARLRAWVTMALGARVEGQARWPALATPGAAGDGRAAAGRWLRPRPLPWEDGDGSAGR